MKITKMTMKKIPQLNKFPMRHLLNNLSQLNNNNHNNKQSNKHKVLKSSRISLKH